MGQGGNLLPNKSFQATRTVMRGKALKDSEIIGGTSLTDSFSYLQSYLPTYSPEGQCQTPKNSMKAHTRPKDSVKA